MRCQTGCCRCALFRISEFCLCFEIGRVTKVSTCIGWEMVGVDTKQRAIGGFE